MMTTAVVAIMLIHSAEAAAEVAVEGKFTVKNSPPEVDVAVSKGEQTYIIIKVNVRDANSVKDIRKIVLSISGPSKLTAVREHGKWKVDGTDSHVSVTKIVRVNQSISSETWVFYVKLREGTWKVVAKVYDGETFVVEDQTIVVKYSSTSDEKLDTNKVTTTDTNWLTKFIRSLYAPFESMLRLSIIIRDFTMALNRVLTWGLSTPSNIFFAL